MTRVALFLYGMILLASPAKAQTDQYIYYDLSDAVDNEVIKGVIKDQNGFIWFATDQGVLKYDGKSTQLFREGLQSAYTKNFLTTSDNRLLVINDLGIREIVEEDSLLFAPFQWGGTQYNEPLGYPKSIFQDRNGNIWIGEYNALLRINSEGYKRFELGQPYQSISYHRTFSFKEDAFGTLWIAPFKGSLLKYDPDADEVLPVDINLPVTEVTGISVLRGDYILIGGKEGLFQLKVDSDQQILSEQFYSEVKNISALQSAREQLFIGTWDSGLKVFDFERKRFGSIEEVDFNDVVDFYYDRSVPEIWVVGSENVGLISFSVIHSFQSVGKSRVESVTNVGDEIYYSIGQELKKFTWDNTGPGVSIISSKTNYFDRIQADSGAVWIGDSFGAIMCYDLKNEELLNIKDSTGSSIKYVTIDRQGNKWFAGDSEHLIRIGKGQKSMKYYPLKSSNIVRQAPDGQIYVGCWGANGLFRFLPSEDKFDAITLELDFDLEDQLSVEDIAIDPSNGLWLATNHGLLTGKDGSFKRVRVPNLEEDVQLKAVAIKEDIVWISGDFGVVAYDGKDAILFNTKNGLPSKLLNWRGLKPYKEGVLISSAKGLVMAKSDLVKFEKTPSPVILSISVDGQAITSESDLSVAYKGALQVEYTTLTYPGKQVIYQSRLIGLNDDWSDPTSNRQVSYLGFSEGNYQLEVRSREIGALWSDPVILTFTVPKPWFQTWWAYVMFTVATVIAVTVVVRVYNYSLILQKRRFRKIIEERTQQINEQKNEIISQKNHIIQQKEELLAKTEAVHKSQQALTEADVNFLHLKEKQLKDQIEYRDKQITTQSLNLIQKNEALKSVKDKLEELIKSHQRVSGQDIRKALKLIDDSFKQDKDWDDFKLYFEQIYTGFYAKLKVNCPALTTQELRHCALIRLNLSVNECATILGISPDSVKVSRSRIRKKLELEQGQNLTDFILSI
ncbi:ligand-binding sensor domain-containing protein [Marinoscillum sp.]|uniref:ligand-binding sensor domain-containing protein n=1 Tax=Marinoscillum sp. TaxID=2024838 RepID=UPI003BA9B9BC